MSKTNKSLKTYFNWSTGKDSALALHYLQQGDAFNINLLLTSVNSHFDRVSMHGLRRSLLEAQAKSLGIQLSTIELPEQPDMQDYEQIMTKQLATLTDQGYQNTIFGDIFLEDLKVYREKQLAPLGIKAHFPLWKRDTKELLLEFIALGFKAIVVTVKSELLDQSFVGRVLDAQFIADLPDNVDPCGENGEFHTFCFDGPIFEYPIAFTKGEIIYRSYNNPDKTKTKEMGFWYLDLV